MAVLGGRARIFRCAGEKKGLARCPAPHFEAWKLDSGAKITERIISGQLKGILISSIS